MKYTDNSEPSPQFRLWVGISVIAACLQRKCYLPWGMFDIYPNLYIVLVGPSGSRKGTAMGPGYKMLSELGIKMSAEAITREALIRDLKKSTSTQIQEDSSIYLHSSLTIYSQELTVFLGYNNIQLMADLCDWFDCRDKWTYRTKNMGEDEIIGVWVNLIGATTPDLLQSSLPRDAIGGGLTARMILVYAPRKYKTVIMPFEDEEAKKLRSHLLHDLEKISVMSGPFTVTKAFMDEWSSWYGAQDKVSPFDDVRLSGYVERRPMHVLKLSMIMSASRSSDMVIDRQDIINAVNCLMVVERDMLKAYSGVGKNKLSDVVSRIAAYIGLKKEVTIEELMLNNYFDVSSKDMVEVIRTLKDMGVITEVIRGNKVYIKYRRGIV